MRRRETNTVLAAGAFALIALTQPAMAQLPGDPTPQHPELEAKLKPGANSFIESQARVLLEQKGYSNVSPLMNDKNGIWHGKAIKDQKAVNVSIDYQGHVVAE